MSVTVTVPGGTAELYEKGELTPRRRRPADRLEVQSAPLFAKIRNARKVVSATGEVEENPGLWGPDLVLTTHDADLMMDYQDAKTWGRLKSWTLDRPLPATYDGLQDLPQDLYDALLAEATRVEALEKAGANQFEPSEQTLDDPASPTGASVASATS